MQAWHKGRTMMDAQPSDDRRTAWGIAALLVLTVALYHDTFSHEFSYDDIDVILKNEAIRRLSNLSSLFSPARYFDVSMEYSYRPVVTLMYLLESSAFGANPVGFHAIGILLHGLCGALTAWIGIRMGLDRFAAFLAAAVFVSHPVATEAVNGIGFHEDVLALFFMLVSTAVLLLRPHRSAGPVAAATIAYLLAMFSKEVSMLLPAALWFLLRRRGWPAQDRMRLMAVMGAALVFFVVLRFFIFLPPKDMQSIFKPVALAPKETFLSVIVIAVNYIRLFFIPIGLAASHIVVVHEHVSWVTVGSLTVLAGFVILLARSREFPVRFGGLWCLLFLLPVSQIVATAQPSSERFLYVPLFGASIAFASAWSAHFMLSPRLRRWAPWLIVAALAALTWQRNPVWRSQESLFKDVLRKYPRNSFALNSLGVWAYDLGVDAVAEYYLRQAVASQPGHYHYMDNLAKLYFRMRRYRDCIPILLELARIHPEDANAQLRLAWAYRQIGDLVKCRAVVESIRRMPIRHPDGRRSLTELESRLAADSDTPALPSNR